jgi:protein-disulfide isomerase
MALMAVYAASKNKFWELNDHLYGLAGHQKKVEIKELALTVGMKPEELAGALYDRSIRRQLQRDIRQGNKLGISGTPGYVINGKVYLGQIPAEVLKTGMR